MASGVLGLWVAGGRGGPRFRGSVAAGEPLASAYCSGWWSPGRRQTVKRPLVEVA